MFDHFEDTRYFRVRNLKIKLLFVFDTALSSKPVSNALILYETIQYELARYS